MSYPSTYRAANRSYWRKDKKEKTCPRCSIRAGERVYKKFPDDFGTREMRGTVVPQSWCIECRALS